MINDFLLLSVPIAEQDRVEEVWWCEAILSGERTPGEYAGLPVFLNLTFEEVGCLSVTYPVMHLHIPYMSYVFTHTIFLRQ